MSCIRQVWSNGLDSAFEDICELTQFYPYVTVRAIWGGFVVRPIIYEEYAYMTVKNTVDLSKCLQIAFAFADASGRTPSGKSCFQFNFCFNERVDVVFEAALDFCKQNGFDSVKALSEGISYSDFGEALVKSGLLINPDIHWVTFHGAYDLGYILKAVTGQDLPEKVTLFKEELNVYFCSIYDVRQMLHQAQPSLNTHKLFSAAKELSIMEVPFMTDTDFSKIAGYHALICAICFFKTLQLYYNNKIDEELHSGILYGIEMKPEELLL